MKSKSKSKLRIEIKVYLRDTNRTGEQQRQNMIWFAKQIGLGESTLHDRLNLPDKFEPVELEKIAELLDLDIESVRRLSYDFASVIPSELVNETPSEIGENKVVSVERKELTQGSLKSKRAKKVLLLGGQDYLCLVMQHLSVWIKVTRAYRCLFNELQNLFILHIIKVAA
ncbi:hypothetical protein [Pseudoalteromonas citrea]|uniref:Uncharacterized protein n=1 Tax=Pseudoalteromonas citrea DSM 8771 TaxID=1117314 RepID=U1JND6_9GAMM|nr:hypothetical protein [Pseudoalteromonas citrea]